MDCTNSVYEIKRIPSHAFESAMGWLRSGVSVIPLRLDGSKSPAIPAWREYQDRLPSADEIRDWFTRPAGIGVVCGVVSGGLEVIDFDAAEFFEPWRKLVEDIACRLPVVETGGGGYHVVYRCSVICVNQKIAIDPAREKKTLIETRGQGGYIVGIGSPLAVHSTGDPYIQVAGPFLPEEIPTITERERLKLWQSARSFDRGGELQRLVKQQERKLQSSRQAAGNEPWHRFDAAADWDSLLRGAGWKSRDGEHWTRPGKTFGTSATLRQTTSGDVVLCVFSSNAGIAMNGGHRTLSPSGFIAETRFSGDWKAAARYFREAA